MAYTMTCPRCGAEYRDGFVLCADCGVPLVTRDPAAAPLAPPPGAGSPRASAALQSPFPEVELVTVFRSSNRVAIEIAESILRSAEVDYMTRGKDIQGLFGWGAFPSGNSLAMGPMEILVRREDSRESLEMLEHLTAGSAGPELDETFDPDANG